ncbi:hypothetical protein C5167_042953 [Papaver somniferum]|uniref:Bromo domain-containing protein n=1 Tax=Papaver somniferum TaxID=3469 RepID=A0A4Y7L7F7_PAPSO|nr:uncharacterized protein LOC113316860 isoform X2 [Papaver somniferum]RZC80378.1 hypothetical protein C5167_042953 [Papaver somniferum]
MGKIMKRKKKAGGGRPAPSPKLDFIPSSRKVGGVVKSQRSQVSESDHKRNIRRRNPSYYGYQDFDDDDEDEEEEEEEDDDDDDEEERRREKKMKLVLKLPAGRYSNNNHNKNNHHHSKNNSNYIKDEGFSGVDSVTSPTRLEDGGRRRTRLKKLEVMSESTSSEYGGGSVVKKCTNNSNKKRKIQSSVNDFYDYDDDDRNVDGDDDEEEDDDDGDDRCEKLFQGSSDQKIQRTKKERGQNVDIKETSSVSGVPLPDRQELELILDRLQRKDTYDVFAQPVDPDELPDYYDVIEHPMDFGTIRKKLAGGTYSNLEELENDVHLVCSNAMQYNAAETVYFKQANSIQELARTKFQSLRIDIEHAKAEAKSEQKTKSNSLVKKPEKNSSCTPFQEPVGSDFSSGATLASVVDTCSLSIPAVQAGCEKPNSGDGLVNENSYLTENKPDEAEEQLSEKDVPTKLVKRIVVIDENRRKSYNISSEPVVDTESIFTPFEGDTKQLVDVMLHEDHSYARSLARFAAALGPFAWKVASLRIEQALPTGMNFGRGWVGEYEPLPKPLLMPKCRTQKAQATLSLKVTESRTRNSSVVAASSKPVDPANNSPLGWPVSARKPPVVGSDRVKPVPLATHKQENKLTINFAKPENILRQIELNSSPSSSGTPHSASPRNPFARDSETKNRTIQMVSRNGNVDQSAAFKKPEVVREVINNSTKSDWVSRSPKFISKTEARSRTHSPRGNQNQGTNEPNQMIRVFAEKTQHQLTSSKPPTIDIQQLMMSVPSQRRGDSSPVATGDRHQGLNDADRITRMLSEKREHQLKWQNRPTTDTRELMMSVPSPRRNDCSATASDHHLFLGNPSQMPRMLTEKTQEQLKSSNPHTIGTQQLMMPVSYPRRDGSSAAATDHHQGLSNPNQMLRMLAEKTQQQLKASNLPTTGTQQLMSVSSPRTDDSSAASTAAARAWMSLGAPHLKPLERPDPPRIEMSAASLFNATQESSQSVLQFRGEPPSGGLQFQSLNRFHPQLLGREPHFQNSRQMVFPQRVTADLSQFQMQPPWQGFIQHPAQTNKKRDMLPPDLNLTFQSSGSPGILAEPQLPDLALQL